MTLEPKIYPCECGGDGELITATDGKHSVVCMKCGKSVGPFTSKRMALNSWNDSVPHGEAAIIRDGTVKVYRDGYILKLDNGEWVCPNIRYYPNNRNNYPNIDLNGDMTQVHRLVAEAYVENDDPQHKDCVDHLNGDKFDWLPENLEWVTKAENTRRAAKNGLNPNAGKSDRYDPEKCGDIVLRNMHRMLRERNMTFHKLALAIGKHDGYFSACLSRNTPPPVDVFLDVAKVLNCNPADFWEGWEAAQ